MARPRNQPQAPPPQFTKFLELPGEIRNRIYSFLLVDPYGLILGLSRGKAKAAGLPPHITTWLNDNRQKVHFSHLLTLSLVSRQIHHESQTLFFSCNRFLFPSIRSIASFTEKRPQKILDMITAVDAKTHQPNPRLYPLELESLACLERFPSLRRFYMSSWMDCREQGLISELLASYLSGLSPAVEAVVELGYCYHCQGEEGMLDGREWWVWRRGREGKAWDVVVRKGDFEIERVGREMRGRPLPPEWALGKLPSG
jgi:hypothetical protein